MPLVGYHLIGFEKEPISFNQVDFERLQDPDQQAEAVAFFADCPYRLNFFFHNAQWSHRNREGELTWLLHGRIGHQPRYPTTRPPGEAIEYFLAGRPHDRDAINFVFTSNATTKPEIPLTPWMMAHRMGHVQMLFQEGDFVSEMGRVGDIIFSHVYGYRLLAAKRKNGDGKLHWANYDLYPCTTRPIPKDAPLDALYFHGLWKALTTSRAGRKGVINGFEYIPEWMAQYLRFGEVRFPEFLPERLNLQKIHRTDHCIQSPIPEGELVARTKYPTTFIAQYIEGVFEGILDRWRGEVVVT